MSKSYQMDQVDKKLEQFHTSLNDIRDQLDEFEKSLNKFADDLATMRIQVKNWRTMATYVDGLSIPDDGD